MILLDGKKTSNDIKDEIALEVQEIISNGGKKPHLAAILVGNNGASETYVNAKVKACERVGFDSTLIRLSKDVSEDINMDISTISRVVNSKYVETPYGIKSLKYYFSESMSKEGGENVSVKEIKSIIKDKISQEITTNPLNDQALVDFLNHKGYKIARRTVAKYREQMHIPVARLRKKI